MDQGTIWEYYQNESLESFENSRPRLEFLAEQLAPGSRVLNVGVGGGIFEDAALARGLVIHTLDPDQKAIETLRARLSIGDRARVGLSQAIPFADGSFDAVVMSEVLEHLDDQVLGSSLAEVRRVLAPSGRFLGTVPSREELASQVVICPDCGKKFHRWGHVQSFDRGRLASVLSPHFDAPVFSERLFINWRMLSWKGRAVAALKSSLLAVGVHGAGETLFFAARRR